MEKLEKLLDKHHMTEEEAITAFKQLQNPKKKRKHVSHNWNPKRIKLGMMTDTHVGSKFFDENVFNDAVRTYNREGVDAVYHAGDVIEGMSNRDGHIYELEDVGTSSQLDHAAELIDKIKQPFYFITGNHDEWSKKKANQGVDVGKELSSRIGSDTFLGEYIADIELAKNVVMRLSHEGSSAYALSYSGQKRINGLEGGTKPDVVFNGHIHKALYMFYRNIHYFEGGTMQTQTPFMAMKGSPAMVGYWVLDFAIQDGNIKELSNKFYPYY